MTDPDLWKTLNVDPDLPVIVYDEQGRPSLITPLVIAYDEWGMPYRSGGTILRLDDPALADLRAMFTGKQRKAAARSSRSKFDPAFRDAVVAEVRALRAARPELGKQASIQLALDQIAHEWTGENLPDWTTVDRWEKRA